MSTMRRLVGLVAFALALPCGGMPIQGSLPPLPGCPSSFIPLSIPELFLGQDYPFEELFFFQQILGGRTASELAAERVSLANSLSSHLDPTNQKIPPILFRRIRGMDFVRIADVYPDYDTDRDLVIRIDDRSHASLVVGGVRFDGSLRFTDSRNPSERIKNLERGIFLRFRGLPPFEISGLRNAILAGEKIRDFNCMSSLVQLLERFSGLRLVRRNPGLPLLPTEILLLFFDGRLTDGAGNRYFPESRANGIQSLANFFLNIAKVEVPILQGEMQALWSNSESRSYLVEMGRRVLGREPTGGEFGLLNERISK